MFLKIKRFVIAFVIVAFALHFIILIVLLRLFQSWSSFVFGCHFYCYHYYF